MRMLFALPLLLAAGCSVENDPQNDEVTLQYNEEQAQNALESAGNTAENIGSAMANDVESAGEAIQNQVGDVDVDVDVNRNEPANQQ